MQSAVERVLEALRIPSKEAMKDLVALTKLPKEDGSAGFAWKSVEWEDLARNHKEIQVRRKGG